jgi:hypothetical protein
MLFAHAVLGCCSHHLHACGESHGSVGLIDSQHDCPDTCGDHSNSPERSGHEHQGPDDCQGASCDFGRPAKERDVKSCHLIFQPAAVPPSEVMPALTARPLNRENVATGLLPTVRRHLVYQVLLI